MAQIPFSVLMYGRGGQWAEGQDSVRSSSRLTDTIRKPSDPAPAREDVFLALTEPTI